MKTGFTFKSRHSNSFGLVMKTVSRPIHPEMKSYTYESPLMDGSYDFSYANSYGREFYKSRIFTLSMQVYAHDLGELMQKISRISSWLTGRGELLFDDMPLVKWNASVLNSIDYAPERYGRKAVLTVSFEVNPFSQCIFDTSDGAMLDMAVPLGTAMPIDIESAFTFNTNTVEVINGGTWYARPILVYESGDSGVFRTMTIECNGRTMNIRKITSSGMEKIVIDLEKHTVTDGSSNLMPYFDGEFFELAPGTNTITSSADISQFTTQVIYTPEFMYDFDRNWGDVNA